MSKKTLKIHSKNILPIIKKWLYSEKDIFVRELVSNACDAISKLQKISSMTDNWEIHIDVDKEKRTLTFTDNGIGMDSEEVEKYIAQIAFSGAEEFLEKYQTNHEEDQIIGHFGLGFYSSYMVAEKVEIHTLSHKPDSEGVHWSCDGSSTYTITKSDKQQRGTQVVLTVSEDEFLDTENLRKALDRYCAFLPYPIFFNGNQINKTPPLWIKPSNECTENEYKAFYRTLFPLEPEPLFWVHLNIDFPFHLKGILYFPKVSQEKEVKKDNLKLFCNRVFVSDQCQQIFPDYLTILKGVIESPDIPLNVSRSYLQMDRTVRQLGAHISKKISDRLSALYHTERDKFLDYWKDIELIIKYGALQDEKFYDRVKQFLVWENSSGDWESLEEHKSRTGKEEIYYSPEKKHLSQFLNLYKEKNISVLIIPPTMINQALLQYLEGKLGVKLRRIDSALNDILVDSSREKTLLDSEGKTQRSLIADFFKRKLSLENLEIEAKSLADDHLPAFLMIKEEERRFRDSMAYQNQELKKHSHAMVKPTFVVNTNNKLIQAIQSVDAKDTNLAKEMALSLYDLTCLSQKEMDTEAISSFVTRSTAVLEKLAHLATEK